MSNTIMNQFAPDYAIRPGEILEETLAARGLMKTIFAKRCGLSAKTVSQIITGKAPVTPETAIQFERVLGVSASVWNNLEAFFRLHAAQAIARKRLEAQTAWADEFPINELVKKGIFEKPVNAVDAVEKLLNFFGVGSVDAWKGRFSELSVVYRQSPSFESAPKSVAAWLRLGELYAAGIYSKPYSRAGFNSALREIRKLTVEPPNVFEPKMKEMCAEAGVALVFVSELPGTHLSGATRWLGKDKALIMLSLRHKSDDHLWFSFFHEAAHVLLHGKKNVFLDDTGTMSGDKEDEANQFAANMLIPENEYSIFTARKRFYKDEIKAFARKMGIAPGIVVGRLQHEKKIPYIWLNGLKRKFTRVETKE